MKQKLLLILILVLAGLYLLNIYRASICRTELKGMSPEQIINEYFIALNNHDKVMVKQIIFPDKKFAQYYWKVKNVKVVEIEQYGNQIEQNNLVSIIYKVKFEVNFEKNSYSTMPSGMYNWTFNMVKNKDNNQWYLFDYGY